MLKNRSFAFKMSFAILVAVSAIFIVSFFVNFINTREIIFNYVKNNARKTVHLNIAKIEDILNRVEIIPSNLARLIEDSKLSDKQIQNILKSIVLHNKEIFGSTVAIENRYNRKSNNSFAPYYFLKNNKLSHVDLSNQSYDFKSQDWYKTPRELEKPMWVEPYFDKGGGNILMTTYSVPIFTTTKDNKKKFAGMVTADISLEWLDEIVNSISILKSGFAFLISTQGIIISHPNKNYIMKSFNEFTSNHPEIAKEEEEDLLSKMLNAQEGIVEYKSIQLNKDAYLLHTHLPSNNWTLALVFPKDELYTNLDKLNNYLIIGIVVGLFFIIFLVISVSRRMTKPLYALSEATSEIAKGNFHVTLPSVSSNDEVGKLTKSMGFMLDELNHYIADLKKTTAEKEQYESELRIAHNIQMGMIPKVFPDRKEIEIYAKLKPAREVGGDLYDFFFLDKDNICITIGDVSGKGVPASLLMAVTRTLLRSYAKPGLSSADIINLINKSLNENKESRLFVTYFLLIFNIRTGKLNYSNAGHNPPILINNNGNITFLESKQSYPLGISTLSRYEANEIVMNKGDKLFLYTDGITEAQNIDDEMFGEERLEESLKTCSNSSASKLCETIFEMVENFVGTAEQYDDMTVVCFNYIAEE